jgi:hypothetical protein
MVVVQMLGSEFGNVIGQILLTRSFSGSITIRCTRNISLGESHQNRTEIEVLRSSRHFSAFVDATYLEALFS